MYPNSRQLARRDLAASALLGIIASHGSNFGGDSQFAGEFSADFATEMEGDFEGDFENDFAAEFAADAPVAPPKPTATQAINAYRTMTAMKVNRSKRARLMNPNAGSDLKIERYAFSISQNITLGTTVALQITGQPDTTIRPQMVSMSVPSYFFATIFDIKVANVSVMVGPGGEDAYDYAATAVGRALDMPQLTPANRATVTGSYTGLVPPGFVGGVVVPFTVTFKGPSHIVA